MLIADKLRRIIDLSYQASLIYRLAIIIIVYIIIILQTILQYHTSHLDQPIAMADPLALYVIILL